MPCDTLDCLFKKSMNKSWDLGIEPRPLSILPLHACHLSWLVGGLDDQIWRVHDGSWSVRCTRLPVQEKYEIKLGPGDRTQALRHSPTARFPSELAMLVV